MWVQFFFFLFVHVTVVCSTDLCRYICLWASMSFQLLAHTHRHTHSCCFHSSQLVQWAGWDRYVPSALAAHSCETSSSDTSELKFTYRPLVFSLLNSEMGLSPFAFTDRAFLVVKRPLLCYQQRKMWTWTVLHSWLGAVRTCQQCFQWAERVLFCTYFPLLVCMQHTLPP